MLYAYNALIKAMEAVVKNTVEGYQYDFYEYDINTLKDMEDGDEYLWITREHGTHFSGDPEYLEAILNCWEPRYIARVIKHTNDEYEFIPMNCEQFEKWQRERVNGYIKHIRELLHNRYVFDITEGIKGTVWYEFGYIYIRCMTTIAIEDDAEELYKAVKDIFRMTAYSFYKYSIKRLDYEAA